MLLAKSRCPIRFQGSKSVIQRLMAIQAISNSALTYTNFSNCADVQEMSNALISSGFVANRTSVNKVSYSPQSAPFQDVEYSFQESATALRLWISICAANPEATSIITISEQLTKRPIEPLLRALRSIGADIVSEDMTLRICGKQLSGGRIDLPSDISSQFYSSLLLIAPTMQQDLHITIPPDMVSRSYLELTLDIMSTCGIQYQLQDGIICVPCGQYYHLPEFITIETDWSSAAFFLCLGTLLKDGLTLELDYLRSTQPDRAIVPILQDLGAEIDLSEHLINVHNSALTGGSIDCRNNPDLVPLLSIMGLFGTAPLRLLHLAHLRYKESDRIAGITSILDTIGAKYKYAANFLSIYPLQTTPAPCILNTQNDHRLMMAAAMLSLQFPQLEQSETRSVTKSFPEFWDILHSLQLTNKKPLHISKISLF